MGKIRKRPAREEKRNRNIARKKAGEPAARGARRNPQTPVALVLMGKGQFKSWTPEWAKGRMGGVPRRGPKEDE